MATSNPLVVKELNDLSGELQSVSNPGFYMENPEPFHLNLGKTFVMQI